jgi:hypothetical protein
LALALGTGLLIRKVEREVRALIKAKAEAEERSREVDFAPSASGITAEGLAVPLRAGQRAVLFVVHEGSTGDDLRKWGEVGTLAIEHNLRLIGFCEGLACIRRLTNVKIPRGLEVFAYADLATGRALMRLDRMGQIAVVNSSLTIVDRPRIPRDSTEARNLLEPWM